ncbi:MAG: Sulfate-transporting ATPase [Ferruginibacter sp.]|uniref:ABC transporter ATP-binding protein n=1 Tax=Ferruginibacter sp. TaxID=1940288 RepID=UPI00265B3595|nr:ABC transporter ATP-binding protein [Ferruginibacter sp.]MDB5278242.1 Sulfate-transporting ATPase [Ferruginibacter sp.]
MYCVETSKLLHQFLGEEMVLNDISLQVNEGSIYGFLGPNGAGKTTTLKLILGLLKKQQGEIFIFGKQVENNRIEILRNIGSLIESPSLYGHLTASENLSILQKIYRCPKQRIEEVLHLAGLSSTGNKKASQFSLGMKQRLSIAIALLHSPSLLILDEPTNGLDPNGMIEIRELLTRLNQQQGTTIIISSHLLGEIEKLITHVGVINKGKILFQGTLNDLKNKQQESLFTVIETSHIEKAMRIIAAHHLVAEIKDGKIILPALPKKTIAVISRQLVENGIELYEIGVVKNDLETIFMNLINN